LSQFGHFSDKGEGSLFRDFLRTSLKDGPFQKLLSEIHYTVSYLQG